jgi:ribosomal protein S18 acetylase RimI-like enzyme
MRSDDNFLIRPMTRGEVDLALDWAAAEGWNPGLDDAESFHAADPQGFHVGLLDGEPVAMISAVRYGAGFAFVGFYIVKPAFRGRGYGLRIWNEAMATVAGRNVGLDGVPDQQGNYRKSGFALAYRNIRYAGAGGGAAAVDADIVPLASIAFAEIERYDRAFFPDDRRRFLEHWIVDPPALAVAIRDGSRLAGYAVLRRCRSGYNIGPLFADDAARAERLFVWLRSRVPATDTVYLDVPEVNGAALELAARHALAPAFETARMYTGAFPQLPFARLFGVTTFELG